MATITLMVGPPGSGKSTLAQKHERLGGVVRVSQDDQGKQGHMDLFEKALANNQDIVVDRMNFDKNQRNRYLEPAKKAGYTTRIIVVHVPLATCLERCNARTDHPTIQDSKSASQAINLFFSKYERVEDNEAGEVLRLGWAGVNAPRAICSDLDGTLCNVDHRLHHVRPPKNTLVGPTGEMIQILGQYEAVDLHKPLPKFKKNWKAFMAGIKDDAVNQWCAEILNIMSSQYKIVYCSGRSDNERKATVEWLQRHKLDYFFDPLLEREEMADLFMRNRQDSRSDDIAKEIILDFEILPRYNPMFIIDDRPSVCRMWRKRDLVVLQCNDKEF